jgi:hypothetical protein
LLSSGLKITQVKDDQDEEWLYVQEGKDSNLDKNSFGCSFLRQLKELPGMELSFCQRLN